MRLLTLSQGCELLKWGIIMEVGPSAWVQVAWLLASLFSSNNHPLCY